VSLTLTSRQNVRLVTIDGSFKDKPCSVTAYGRPDN